MSKSYKKLEDALHYCFQDKALLECALTHASYPQGKQDNERLEFLGDRVLGLVLSQHLFVTDTFTFAVGDMAHSLSFLASRSICAQVATKLDLFHYASLAKGLSQEWEANTAVHSNLCEAIIGAIYIDGGIEKAAAFIHQFWSPWLGQELDQAMISPKNALQEVAQAKGLTPVYQLVSRAGSDHKPVFLVEVSVEGLGSARGEDLSLQSAEKTAARNLLTHLKLQ